jgi:hypothetical protein
MSRSLGATRSRKSSRDQAAQEVSSAPRGERATAFGQPGGGLLELQQAAGNAATSQLVQLGARRLAPDSRLPGNVADVLKDGPTQSLDPATRAAMEASFGADFGQVRIHTDQAASDSARELHASAYTVGQDVVFGARQYAPHTAAGQQVLAHELAHVVQQNQETGVSGSPKGAEQEAAHASSLAAGGGAATVQAAVPQGVQRQPLGDDEVQRRIRELDALLETRVISDEARKQYAEERARLAGTAREPRAGSAPGAAPAGSQASAETSALDEAMDRLARLTAKFVDQKASGKVLLSAIVAPRSKEGMKLWALKLQQMRHSPYGNYLWAYFVQLNDYDHTIAQKFVDILGKEGIAIGPSSGAFGSLKHLDPTENVALNPAVAKLPWGRSVDNFVSAKYELDYKHVGGALSTLLQLSYADGTKIDLDIYDISDNRDPASIQAIADAYVGPGGRVFPSRLSRNTTPNLWRAKQKAIEAMEVSNQDFEFFVSLSLAGVMSNLPMGPVVGPEPLPAGPRIPRRPTVAPRGEPAPTLGEGGFRRPPSPEPAPGGGGGGGRPLEPAPGEPTGGTRLKPVPETGTPGSRGASAGETLRRAPGGQRGAQSLTVKPYESDNPRATVGEQRVGRVLDAAAQRGEIPSARRVRGAAEVEGQPSGDYRFVDKDGVQRSGDLITPESPRVIDNPSDLARKIVEKRRQGEFIVVDLKGKLRRIDSVQADEAAKIAIRTEPTIRRVIFVKGGRIFVSVGNKTAR